MARTQAPEPDATWDGPGVPARVWYGRGNKGLVRPVLLADGFNMGPTDFDWLWEGLDGDPAREQFLKALERVGGWPRIPRLIGVANGVGDGRRNGIPAGVEALRSSGPYFTGTTLFTQAGGRNQLVADLRGVLGERKVTTDNLPQIDGAPGGTLDSFGILADALNAADASRSELDEFLCSSRPTPHTMMTEELSTWILDRVAH
ncbi:hypothetical protein MXD63_18095 [Frankia sp. Cpl3]|nr:hypothetical protein [Parafrankia colletiae]MCK9901978.1 hypothetical protein [Frankia sp. Cpl3]